MTDPGRIHVEPEGRAVVEIAVDHDAKPVRVAKVHVTAAEASRYAAGVVQPRADVEERVVVEHADFGTLARWLSSSGSICVNESVTGADDHTDSFNRPSSSIGAFVRAAREP